ncbi:MAG: hypothetical protein FWG88_09475 [Oscillospiraceae bacterium]|nr:hypothetical protein [Oscillospiraceae bacterium]
MTEIISVRFSNRGKAYFFDPVGLVINKGDNVVVETSKGLEYGECTYGNRMVNDDSIVKPLRPVIRIATENDKRNAIAWKEKEKEAYIYCQKRIEDLGLEMKLVDVEYGFEGNKILFLFTSEGRVDFRELVKDLAAEFRARIELRQIGVRDEAKMIGGLGVCGKQFCCSQFLSEFHPVSIKMAKTQGLSLNPAKISGTCGRLMCCLKYEDAAYEDLVKKAPKIDSFVETPSGKGTVINVNLLRSNVKVRLEDGVDTTLKTFSFDELEVLGGKSRRAEYIAARADGTLEEAGFRTTPPPQLARSTVDASTSDFESATDDFLETSTSSTTANRRTGNQQNRRNNPSDSNQRQTAASVDRSLNTNETQGDRQNQQQSSASVDNRNNQNRRNNNRNNRNNNRNNRNNTRNNRNNNRNNNWRNEIEE